MEFFAQLPPHLLYSGNRYKGLLRPLAQRMFPGLDLENQRKLCDGDSESFIGLGLSKGLHTLVSKRRISRMLEELGIVHVKTLETRLRRLNSLSVAQKAMIFATFMADSWLMHHTSNSACATLLQPKSVIAQSTGGVRFDG